MKAIEFTTSLHSTTAINIPASFQHKFEAGQEIKVIILPLNSAENDDWNDLTTKAFFSGYSDEDSVYDTL